MKTLMKTVAFPTQEELDRTIEAVRQANERLCDLAWVLRRLADPEEFEEWEERPLNHRPRSGISTSCAR